MSENVNQAEKQEMVHLTINNIPIEVPKGTKIMQAAREIGIADIAGPVTPAVDVVAGEHIAQFWIKLPRTGTLAATKRALYERVEAIADDFKGRTTLSIDVDPL